MSQPSPAGQVSADVLRMRDQLFFEGPELSRKLSRFWLLLTLSAVIAGAGVVADSTATVIGAMIVAPLMVPILGSVLAVVLADRDNLLRCAGLVVTGALAVILVGWVLGVLVELPVSAATNSQVAGRVSPTLIDLLAALATGAVGSVALARDDISDTLPGVAIAISLVPPLAVVGLTLEAREYDQAMGALLLFLTNVTAILATGLVVMGIYRVHRQAETSNGSTRQIRRGRAVVAIVVGLVVISVPLGITSSQIAASTLQQTRVTSAATAFADDVGWDVIGVSSTSGGLLVRLAGPEPVPDTSSLQRYFDEAGVDPTSEVTVDLVPVTSVRLGGD